MKMNKFRLKDIANIVNGATPSSSIKEYYGGDIVWITPNDLSKQQKKYITQGERNITIEGYNSCSTKIIPANNILLSSRAPIGLIAINRIDCCTNQGFKNLVIISEKCDVEFLYYYLKYHIKEIENLGSGTTFKEVSKTSLEKYEINLPEINLQKKISSILKKIDDKIVLNNNTNSELENMAKTIYNYWFLQFEFPNDEGKPYKSSGGKMVWNKELKKEIPDGWEVKKLKNFIDIVRGITYSKEDISLEEKENYFPLLKSNNIQNGKINYNNTIYVKNSLVSEKQILDKGSIFITMSSGSKEHMGKTAIIFDDLKYTFGAFCSKIKIKNDFIAFISLFLVSKLFKNIIDNLTLGTSINNINNDHINNIKITIPNKKILKLFEDKIRGIFEKQGKIIFENQELISLRDYLLPLLMNGQVGFKD